MSIKISVSKRGLILISMFFALFVTLSFLALAWRHKVREQWLLVDYINASGRVVWETDSKPMHRIFPPRPSIVELNEGLLNGSQIKMLAAWDSLKSIALMTGNYKSSDIKLLISGKEIEDITFGLSAGQSLVDTCLDTVPTLKNLAIVDTSITQEELELLCKFHQLEVLTFSQCNIRHNQSLPSVLNSNRSFRPYCIFFDKTEFINGLERVNFSWLQPRIFSFRNMDLPSWLIESAVCENPRLEGVLITNCTSDGRLFTLDRPLCLSDEKVSVIVE